MSERPRLLVTGAAGFLGRRLVESLCSRWEIEAIDRKEPPLGLRTVCGPVRWHRADIAEPEAVVPLFESIRRAGGATALVHLAAHYDFTGQRHPEYRRTNVDGTRLLLEAARGLGLERFVFASSVAACDFPAPGRALDETSPPDGRHVYAESKRAGEERVRREPGFPTAVVRFAAMVSDWCEYAPLYVFLETWLSRRWNARILGGRGRSAVPFVHVRDACLALERILALRRELAPGEIVLVSPDGATSHEELFRAATTSARGRAARPIRIPKLAAAVGMVARDLTGRALGRRPFERPWMAAMIDRRLEVDARKSRARLGWAPRERLGILRRLPWMLENRRSQRWLWTVHNRARMLDAQPPLEHRVLRLLETCQDEIHTVLTAGLVGGRIHLPHDTAVALLHGLAEAIHYNDRTSFQDLCRDLAHRRASQGVPMAEMLEALRLVERSCLEAFAHDGGAAELGTAARDEVARTVEFGLDAIEDGYEEVGATAGGEPERRGAPAESR
jgi:nucleoside-diphosphate-sugar epimerase